MVGPNGAPVLAQAATNGQIAAQGPLPPVGLAAGGQSMAQPAGLPFTGPAYAQQASQARDSNGQAPAASGLAGAGGSLAHERAASAKGEPQPDEAGPSGRPGSEDALGAGRRATAVKSKEKAGGAVWAKLAKYPWWPAQVLDEGDPWIPSDSEPPRRGAIPVRFFGTYDFAWIESHRAVTPWEQGRAEHSGQSKQKAFTDAVAEAEAFRATGQLPDGFNEDATPSPHKAGRPRRASAGRNRRREGGGRGGRRGGDARTSRRNVRERQEAILQHLGLAPPPDSLHSHSLCLDGVRRLMAAQAAGQWPPAPQPAAPIAAAVAAAAAQPQPQPQPQPQAAAAHAYSQPHAAAYSGGFSGGFALPNLAHLTPQQLQQMQYLQQQFLQQQYMQQLQQPAGSQAGARPQWPQQAAFQAGYSQLQPGYVQQQLAPQQQAGGVQGALLAAASQQAQMQPRPQ